MSRTSGVLAAMKAVPGGARYTPAPQSGGWGGMSQVAANAMYGNPYGAGNGYGPFLPRPSRTFRDGAFGPMSPIQPVPVDQPPVPGGFPDPRWWQYPVGWNLPTQPGSEGLKLASFAQLKTLSEKYSVARRCIQLRTEEILGLEWQIELTTKAAKAYQGDHRAMRDFGERAAAATKFFRRPDPDYWNFSSWLGAVLEEIFVYDALALIFRPKYGKGLGRGLLGSDLDSIRLVSGQTIRPLLDMHGGKPAPPAPAYSQFLYGVPRSDYQTIISGSDIDDYGLTGAEVNQFRADVMLYAPLVTRRETPYGYPPVEQALLPIISGLQKQEFQLQYFTEGTIPAVYISPGDPNMTPTQIKELQDALNGVAGDPAYHLKVIVLPPGSKVEPQRPVDLSDSFDFLVMNQVCCVPGTQVVTQRGLAPIERVQVGDLVLTHRGRWRAVTKTMRNPVHEAVRTITAKGFDALEVTGNHPVWAARYRQTRTHRQYYEQTDWIAARDVRPKRTSGDFDALTLPVPVMGNSDARLRLADHIHGRGRYGVFERDGLLVHEHPSRRTLPAVVPMDAAFGRLLGFYMAEGSSARSAGQVHWYFDKNELAYHQQVIDDLYAVFGLRAKVSDVPGEECVKITATSTMLAELFSCGIATTKRLPEWAWEGSPEFCSSLLWAWIAGDGTLTPTGWRGYTASRDLAWQMRLIALACGYEPSLRKQKQPRASIKGRALNDCGFIYVVQVFPDKGTGAGVYGTRRGTYRIDGPHLTSPVRSNEPSAYDGNVVYNLEVAEDESYVTTGGTVHNCMAFDVSPVELGIVPDIGATQQGPSASGIKFSAQEARNPAARTATKPLLMFLVDIFNYVLQDICGQADMQFSFEGLVDDEDRAAITALGVEQVQNGISSIDEVRERLDLPPWGLQETSEPVVFTAQGPIPFSMAPQLIANMQNGGQGGSQGTNSGQRTTSSRTRNSQPTVRRGGQTRPNGSHPAPVAPHRESVTPAHSAAAGAIQSPGPRTGGTPSRSSVAGSRKKAVESELGALARHLRKGRLISTWEARHIPARALGMIAEDIAKGVLIDTAVERAGDICLVGEGEPTELKAGWEPPQDGPVFPDKQSATFKAAAHWPGWERDLGLVGAYKHLIGQAFHDAETRGSDLRKKAATGGMFVSNSTLRDLISDEVREVFSSVLTPLWTEAWHLGYAAAQSLVTGQPADFTAKD